MFEVAAAYIGLALGNKLLDRAGDDVADGFEKALVRLYNWARGKLTSRTGQRVLAQVEKDPEGDGQELLAAALADTVDGDETASAELSAMIGELDKLRPPGLKISGRATSGELYGEQAGVEASGPLPAGTSVEGVSEVTGTVHKGAKSVGTEYRSDA